MRKVLGILIVYGAWAWWLHSWRAPFPRYGQR
jgi:hypothetical protein